MATCENNLNLVVKLLQKNANPNTLVEFENENAFHVAIKNNFFEIFDQLLENGAEINIPDGDGKVTPLLFGFL